MRALMLASVELDGDAVRGPQAVDGPRADRFVAQRQLDPVADEQRAEAPLQLALHLPVAGRVLVQRGTQVGAAGVTAAQRAGHVFWAQVVLELGLGERAQQRVVL